MTSDIIFETKKESLQLLNNMFTQWENFLTNISSEEANNKDSKTPRSIKDILSHLWEWQRISLSRMENGLNNTAPLFDWWPEGWDPESEEQLEAINQWIYESNVNKSFETVFTEWNTNFKRLISISDKFTESDLFDSKKYTWLNGNALIAVLEGTYDHHKEHWEKLKLRRDLK